MFAGQTREITAGTQALAAKHMVLQIWDLAYPGILPARFEQTEPCGSFAFSMRPANNVPKLHRQVLMVFNGFQSIFFFYVLRSEV